MRLLVGSIRTLVYQLDEGGDFYFDNCYGFNDPSLYIGRV